MLPIEMNNEVALLASEQDAMESETPSNMPTQDAKSRTAHAENSLFSDFDLFLFGEGVHDQIYEKLGAHPAESGGKQGVHFAVWSPNAASVFVVGDFNDWNTTTHPLKPAGNSGIWECFIEDAKVGQNYKFHIVDKTGGTHSKSDPYGFQAELPPKTASVICDLSEYQWKDGDWIKQRSESNPLEKPVSIYEVLISYPLRC